MKQWQTAGFLLAMALATGCGKLFPEQVPRASAAPDIKRITFEIVARDNRCEPSVLAADRQGGALLITFLVTSVGKQHVFLIPDLNLRMTIPADTQVAIPVAAEFSGIFDYGCTGLPWLGMFDAKGKLAIK